MLKSITGMNSDYQMINFEKFFIHGRVTIKKLDEKHCTITESLATYSIEGDQIKIEHYDATRIILTVQKLRNVTVTISKGDVR